MPRTRPPKRPRRGSSSTSGNVEHEDELVPVPAQYDNITKQLIHGITFRDKEHEQRFIRMADSKKVNTSFAPLAELQKLYIRTAIVKLFRQIGWSGLLDLDYPGYTRPTLEFASSVYVKKRILNFRLYNHEYKLTYPQLCELINAPSDETVTRDTCTNAIVNDLHKFWHHITDGLSYDSSRAKASMIVHPVLRVAHRIIGYSVYARDEPTNVSYSELLILYCMVYPSERKPNFGAFLCQRLNQYSSRKAGPIACGGIVTLISRHPSIPSILTDSEQIPGDRLLTVPRLHQMQMFEYGPEPGSFVWKLRKIPFLRVDRNTRHLLSLATNTCITPWRLHAHRFDNPPPVLAFDTVSNELLPEDDNTDDDLEMEEVDEPIPQPAPGPPDGVHPWHFEQWTSMLREQRRTNDLLQHLLEWAQSQPHPPPPPLQ